MFMLAKNFDEAKKMLNAAMAKNYPDTFSVAIFIDDGIKRGFCTDNRIDDMQLKRTLTACYNSALDVLNDLFSTTKTTADESDGIKLIIKKQKETEKMIREKMILTDDDIQMFKNKIVDYVKRALAYNYSVGKTHGDYYSGCHFDYADVVDAVRFGASTIYDMLMEKIDCDFQDDNKTNNDTEGKDISIQIHDDWKLDNEDINNLIKALISYKTDCFNYQGSISNLYLSKIKCIEHHNKYQIIINSPLLEIIMPIIQKYVDDETITIHKLEYCYH